MIKLDEVRSKLTKLLAETIDRAEARSAKLFRAARELLERLDTSAKPADAKPA